MKCPEKYNFSLYNNYTYFEPRILDSGYFHGKFNIYIYMYVFSNNDDLFK